jgi:hypothetical protein
MRAGGRRSSLAAPALIFVVRLGFEPRQTESESVVLPLHNRTVLRSAMLGVFPNSAKLINYLFNSKFFTALA